MTITAKIVLDSISNDIRLTTMRLRYPRSIHSELMTHRVFSRNSASSRAIPVAKMIAAIREDPFVPEVWGSKQPGMQGGLEIDAPVLIHNDPLTRELAWMTGMEAAIELAEAFDKAGYHKQIINRLLEPWMHIEVLVSSTKWSNFFALRDHPAAEPHIHKLARHMRRAMADSTPGLLHSGEWHLPFVPDAERTYGLRTLIELSVARCAHLSYETVEGNLIGVDQALRICCKLLGSQPIHASPAEHQATPDNPGVSGWLHPEKWGNFEGWIQYRKTLAGESA